MYVSLILANHVKPSLDYIHMHQSAILFDLPSVISLVIMRTQEMTLTTDCSVEYSYISCKKVIQTKKKEVLVKKTQQTNRVIS
jgi:hypothetical protein